MANTDQPVPEYLQPTYQMLNCVFKSGLSEEEYDALIVILKSQISIRSIATVFGIIQNKEYIEMYNELGDTERPTPSAEATERMRQKLQACGYEAWLASS